MSAAVGHNLSRSLNLACLLHKYIDPQALDARIFADKELRMLVLNRKMGESIVIGDNVVVTVLRIRANRVQLGFKAPEDIVIRFINGSFHAMGWPDYTRGTDRRQSRLGMGFLGGCWRLIFRVQ